MLKSNVTFATFLQRPGNKSCYLGVLSEPRQRVYQTQRFLRSFLKLNFADVIDLQHQSVFATKRAIQKLEYGTRDYLGAHICDKSGKTGVLSNLVVTRYNVAGELLLVFNHEFTLGGIYTFVIPIQTIEEHGPGSFYQVVL